MAPLRSTATLVIVLLVSGYLSLALAASVERDAAAVPPRAGVLGGDSPLPLEYPRPAEDAPQYPFARITNLAVEDITFFSDELLTGARNAIVQQIERDRARGRLEREDTIKHYGRLNDVMNRLVEQNLAFERGERAPLKTPRGLYLELDLEMMDMALGWRGPFVAELQAALLDIQKQRDQGRSPHPTALLKIGRWPRAVEQFANRQLADRVAVSLQTMQSNDLAPELGRFAQVLLAKLTNPAALVYSECDGGHWPGSAQCPCSCECTQIEVDADMIEVWLAHNRASLIDRLNDAYQQLRGALSPAATGRTTDSHFVDSTFVMPKDRFDIIYDPALLAAERAKQEEKKKASNGDTPQAVVWSTILIKLDCKGPSQIADIDLAPSDSDTTPSARAAHKHLAHLRRGVMSALRGSAPRTPAPAGANEAGEAKEAATDGGPAKARAVLRRQFVEERALHQSQFEAELGVAGLWPSDQDGAREYQSLTNPQRVWQRMNCMQMGEGPNRQSSPAFFHYFDFDEQGHSKWACFKGFDEVPMPQVEIHYSAAGDGQCTQYQLEDLCYHMFQGVHCQYNGEWVTPHRRRVARPARQN